MALQDYSAFDEADYYGQDFERNGVVSVWAGIGDLAADPDDLDILQDRCGVGYYSLDNQESNCHDNRIVPLRDLLCELSYAEKFMAPALQAAFDRGIDNARWVVVQYDFAYDPKGVKREIQSDPTFLGVFAYATIDE